MGFARKNFIGSKIITSDATIEQELHFQRMGNDISFMTIAMIWVLKLPNSTLFVVPYERPYIVEQQQRSNIWFVV